MSICLHNQTGTLEAMYARINKIEHLLDAKLRQSHATKTCTKNGVRRGCTSPHSTPYHTKELDEHIPRYTESLGRSVQVVG